MPKKYAILGATGQIGHVIVEELLKKGYEVRAIGRDLEKLKSLERQGAKIYSMDFDDADFLTEVFNGCDAAFTFLPPAHTDDDYLSYQDKVGHAIHTALAKTRVPYVVNLSSLGAQYAEGTGPIKGLYRQEQRLNALPGINILHLRASFFMENLFSSIPIIKREGVNGSPIKGDIPIPLVDTTDIAKKAVEFLDRLSFMGQSVFEYVGPKPLDLNEVTTILGKAIGNPELKYVQFSSKEAGRAMAATGMKPRNVELFLEMYKAINEGRLSSTQTLSSDHRGRTSIEEFSKLFLKKYKTI